MGNNRRSFYKSAANVVGTFGSAAFNRYYRNRNTQKRVTDGTGVTTQYDRKVVYRKKTMPYRRKKAWRKFSNKVNAVIERGLGTKTVLFNTAITEGNTPSLQGILSICFYGCNGLADGIAQNYCGFKDIATMMANDPMNFTGRMKFKSAVLDVTFQAKPENTVGTELDIYELMFSAKQSAFTNVNQIFAQAANITGNISGTGTGLSITTRGVTPFELPEAFSIGHFSVLKKTKYLLPPGNTATYQIRDPRMYSLQKEEQVDQNAINPSKKGMCRVLYCIFKPVVASTAVVFLNAGVTRKYSYYVTEQNRTEDQQLP